MDTGILQPLLAALFISIVSFSGALALFNKKFDRGNSLSYFISFAAGVMLSAALLDILPEAIESANEPHDIFIFVLCGIVMSFLIERFALYHHHHHQDTHHINSSAYLILIGDAFHNFVDGLAIAATYIANPAIGIATTIAIAAHEIPQELADFSILVHSGLKRKQALLYNFISALTSVVGVLVGYYLLKFATGLTGPLLGLTGGIFLYIALADLIPELHNDNRAQKNWKYALIFVIGIIFMFLLIKATHS